MMVIKIAICDDIPGIAKWMKKVLESHDFGVGIDVDDFVSGWELFENAMKKRYDIILLDIELYPSEDSGPNGMSLSNKIKDVYPEVIIIFFTGNTGYERKLLDFEPFRFLNKPVRDYQLIDSVDSAVKRIQHWEDKYFDFRHKGIWYRVRISQILYFQSARPYIEIKCIDDSMSFRGKMDDVENRIIELSSAFIRVSKSYLLNRKFIRNYTSKEVIMSNGEYIAVSRSYAKTFLESMRES